MGKISVPFETKWYNLLLEEGGEKKPLHFTEVSQRVEAVWSHRLRGSIFVDHIIHPRAVLMYAALLGHTVDELSLELLIGRWVLEGGRPEDSDTLGVAPELELDEVLKDSADDRIGIKAVAFD